MEFDNDKFSVNGKLRCWICRLPIQQDAEIEIEKSHHGKKQYAMHPDCVKVEADKP